MTKKIRRMPSIKGGRRSASTGLEPDGPLERALRREAAHFGVSRSFVLHTLAAYVLDVPNQPDYATDADPPTAARAKLRLVKRRA